LGIRFGKVSWEDNFLLKVKISKMIRFKGNQLLCKEEEMWKFGFKRTKTILSGAFFVLSILFAFIPILNF
jgi:hypothetical protein